MKSKMVLCDRAVGQVPGQGAVFGQGFATRVKIGGGGKTAEPRQGVVMKTRAVVGLLRVFAKCAQRVRIWRHRRP